MKLGWCALAAILCSAPAAAATGKSTLTARPDDPRAILVHGAGDGKADDSDSIQQAIDAAAGPNGGGIVFLPSGSYRISRTLLVPPGVRLYGFGARRPVILLGDRTPGFQTGVATMVAFTGGDQYRVGAVP